MSRTSFRVTSRLFAKDIGGCHVSGQTSGALNFNSVVVNTNVNVGSDTIIAVENGVRYDFVQGLVRINNIF